MVKEIHLISKFVEIDDKINAKKLLSKKKGRKGLHASELACIFLMQKSFGYKVFKEYYKSESAFLKTMFPKIPKYKALLKHKEEANKILLIYLENKSFHKGDYYIDSTPLPVCKLIRSTKHKVLSEHSSFGYSSTGTFFGMKLHIVTTSSKELVSFAISKGNQHDIHFIDPLTSDLKGRIAADKGYLSNEKKENLFSRGLCLITKRRKNMQKQFLSAADAALLRSRPKIENVIRKIKHFLGAGLSFARSYIGALSEIITSLAAYKASSSF